MTTIAKTISVLAAIVLLAGNMWAAAPAPPQNVLASYKYEQINNTGELKVTVNLSWIASVNGTDLSYNIYALEFPTKTTLIGTTTATTYAFDATAFFNSNTPLMFAVAAKNADGESPIVPAMMNPYGGIEFGDDHGGGKGGHGGGKGGGKGGGGRDTTIHWEDSTETGGDINLDSLRDYWEKYLDSLRKHGGNGNNDSLGHHDDDTIRHHGGKLDSLWDGWGHGDLDSLREAWKHYLDSLREHHGGGWDTTWNDSTRGGGHGHGGCDTTWNDTDWNWGDWDWTDCDSLGADFYLFRITSAAPAMTGIVGTPYTHDIDVESRDAKAVISYSLATEDEFSKAFGFIKNNNVTLKFPQGAMVDNSTGVVTWTPTEEGDYGFLVTVKINNGSTETEFQLAWIVTVKATGIQQGSDITPLKISRPVSSANATTSISDAAVINMQTYPNPVVDMVTVRFNGVNAQATMRLYNAAGTFITTQAFNTHEGVNDYIVNVSSLSTGKYYLTISMNAKEFMMPITIVR